MSACDRESRVRGSKYDRWRDVGDGIKRNNTQSTLGKKRKNVSLLLKDRYCKATATSSQDTFFAVATSLSHD